MNMMKLYKIRDKIGHVSITHTNTPHEDYVEIKDFEQLVDVMIEMYQDTPEFFTLPQFITMLATLKNLL